jgi:AcrR family transcriptional regulator
MNSKRSYVMTGRAAKAEATKARIRAAALELYTGRQIDEFTLEDVAKRAETTVQTVLRAFGSKDALVYEALFDMAEAGVAVKPTPAGDVAAAVGNYYELYEAIGDHVIQQLDNEARYPGLKARLDIGRNNHREAVKVAFASQLDMVSGTARAQLLNILIVATDVYVWKLLRRDMGLSQAAAEALVCRIIEGVTRREEANG